MLRDESDLPKVTQGIGGKGGGSFVSFCHTATPRNKASIWTLGRRGG